MGKKLIPKKDLRLYLVYSESRHGGEVCAGDEDSDWPCHEDIIVDVHFSALYRNPPKNIMFYTSYVVTEDIYKADSLHMAVVKFSDGDTFGRSSGLWEVIGLYHTLKEAADSIEKAKNSKDTPWSGYFSSYETDQVVILSVFDE